MFLWFIISLYLTRNKERHLVFLCWIRITKNTDYTKFSSLNDYIFHVSKKKSNSPVWECYVLKVRGYGLYLSEENKKVVAQRYLCHLQFEKTEGMVSLERVKFLTEVLLKIQLIWDIIPRRLIKQLPTFRKILTLQCSELSSFTLKMMETISLEFLTTIYNSTLHNAPDYPICFLLAVCQGFRQCQNS